MRREQEVKKPGVCNTQRSEASNTEPDHPGDEQNNTVQGDLIRKSNRTVKSCRLLEQLRELNLRKDRREVTRPTNKNDKENSCYGKNQPMKSLTTSIDGPVLPMQLNHSTHHKVNSLVETKRLTKTNSNVVAGSSRPSNRYEEPAVKPSNVRSKHAVRMLNVRKQP